MPTQVFTYTESVCLVVVCVVLIIVGCLGNLITIAALLRLKKLRNATTALVVNLSLADTLFCTFVMPMRAAMFIGKPKLSCGIFLFFFYGNVTVSLMTMVAIAINRYLFVLHNNIYVRVFTKYGTVIILTSVWVYSYSLWSVPISEVWGKFENHVGTPFCRLVEDVNSPKYFLGFFGFVLPLIVITSAYIAIFLTIRKSIKISTERDVTGSIAHRMRQREMNVTRVLGLAYCSFLMFFLPNFIILMIPSMREDPVALTIGEVLLWLSSCCNPFVYVLCSNTYAEAFRALFRIKNDRRNRVSCVN